MCLDPLRPRLGCKLHVDVHLGLLLGTSFPSFCSRDEGGLST